MSITWNFPNNGCGQIRGISDAGIETFNGNEIQSLAREICQNSLDAKNATKDGPVVVEFSKYRIASNLIPGYFEYKKCIETAKRYWDTKKSTKTINFLYQASASINSAKTSVLRISDYNTIGLQDPYGDLDEGWNALTKLDGGATKSGDQAGAFGIGKNAPFCNSDYRLVFYRTLNLHGERAAQGMSRFISFPQNINDSVHTMTTGIGYYGNPDGNLPVESINEIDSLEKRKEAGTDIFIYGFNGSIHWEDQIIDEILENFMLAINKNLLSVIIEDNTIKKESLDKYMQLHKDNVKNAYCYYQVLVRPETKIFEYDFHKMGTLKLSVLVDNNEKLNRKILVTRSSGMKLFSHGNVSRHISFSGILEMQGKKLNEYFREMETPAHDKWVPNRYTENPTQAAAYYKELKQWVKDCVISLGEYSSDEEISVKGLTGLLQDETELLADDDESSKESLSDTIKDMLIQPRETKSNAKGLFISGNQPGKLNKETVKGNINSNGDFPAIRHLSGTRHRRTKEKHRGQAEIDGHDSVQIKKDGITQQPLQDVRIIKVAENKYRISFYAPVNIVSGYIELVAIGENGKQNKLTLKDIEAISGVTEISYSNPHINFRNMSSTEKIKLEFSLIDVRDYAMEVNVYEHN